jgi:hypothetical protein
MRIEEPGKSRHAHLTGGPEQHLGYNSLQDVKPVMTVGNVRR